MEEKYYNLHSLTKNNEEILRDSKCICIYCKKEFDYKEINDYIPDSDGLTAECPYCNIDSVLPKEYNGYTLTEDDINTLNEMYF